ncbi:hypothetical protein EI555_011162 [Monodon monoceros]|uniref:Uncharacterized protein n=1 Tax=Monodon monoceros TaxID=40151 RepID=A0A4U1EC34_MONMO|nr:hypothetical protein EI555_011162 [Monodon monoceros]
MDYCNPLLRHLNFLLKNHYVHQHHQFIYYCPNKSNETPLDLTEVESKPVFIFKVENVAGPFTPSFLENMSISL